MNVSQLELAQGRMIRIARRIGLSGHVICHRRIEFETLEPRLTLSAVAAHMLVDVAPGAANSSPRDFTSSNNAVYFLADESPQASDLWKTNGADQSSLVSQQTSTGSVTLNGLYDYQNNLVFLKSELAQGASGYGLQLWSSQGTQASTAPVRNFGIKSGQVSDQPDVAQDPYFATAAGRLFASIDGRNSRGRELWTSNLTSSGTTMLKDIDSGADSSTPHNWISFGGRVYFSASNAQSGEELWSSDGVATQLVQDFMPGPEGSYPSGMLVANGNLYFATHDLGTDGVYSSDDVMKWWQIADPTTSPILIHDFGPGSGASLIKTQLAFFQGQLYGVAQDPEHGVELWRTDSSPAGVSLLLDINPSGDALPWQPTATYDALYFGANDGVHGEELWKTDGTPAGTVLVRDINTSGSSAPDSLVAKGGELFFSADTGTGRTLWQSDGTYGTVPVPGQSSGASGGADPQGLTILNSTLYYSASTAAAGREPWAARVYSWNAAYLSVDVDRDGIVAPLDALRVINELNGRTFSNPATGQLPDDRPNLGGAYWFDVSPDGVVAPLDALNIINWLNNPGGSAASEGESPTEADRDPPPAGRDAAGVTAATPWDALHFAPTAVVWPDAISTPVQIAAATPTQPAGIANVLSPADGLTREWSAPSLLVSRNSVRNPLDATTIDQILAADDWTDLDPDRDP